ncbi:unnamed protein product [Coregonus sp. 'balchen']|nr:unnamed protein product [Coregonus sp. 'balchen']
MNKDVMIFNGLIALGTVASQTMYNIFVIDFPCSARRNYLYGLAAIGVPALVFYLVGDMLNKSTWDLVSECRLRSCRKLSGAAAFAVLATIIGRAAVAPVTWTLLGWLMVAGCQCVKSYFGFVAKEEKEKLEEHKSASSIFNTVWNRITGVYLYKENKGLPLYNRFNKWDQYSVENNTEAIEKEILGTNRECRLLYQPSTDIFN